ncbi:hypothetical protein NSA56_15115 [Oceanobacillus caeni]|uniref:Uncharacterized protein n=1 Tax=Oceanobacillus caeni TaxID=405946 RepID=A0ABR5MJC5_9BACI|nr:MULTISPECIES: hypothetical protein [Bacillaceae]KKE78253.1 hypothetical protein WH51_13645 [Bacilli bacterium VT-13-104]PZD83104.1 hypothetical protein DEJ64_16205 [Bacilli bacterium]KPH75654.1 hypothetical protein AFL42_08790 [Oceanobacillus caeni]MBU8792321.1 hypothetical protein [Oceanobacillus caeni]MCR1835677.1 hypothetical protein [Oceanobacillus caeni]
MKRYLTVILILLSIVFIIIGIGLDLYWSGMVGWGLAFISLIFAVYFTKYIPNDKKERESESK